MSHIVLLHLVIIFGKFHFSNLVSALWTRRPVGDLRRLLRSSSHLGKEGREADKTICMLRNASTSLNPPVSGQSAFFAFSNTVT